ncbi:hypothetical protein FNV43_RR18202 [Rhamnella rubrinervis]|uniref:BAG domain-containing protein n=1 Tax=Rhamnella rubrinervis TaxID=2594499 RepID=A0A8K0E5W0_9ROSA|nr:hypothetical protein FNV43_RR18202 [Rhamnella rubrinervis]
MSNLSLCDMSLCFKAKVYRLDYHGRMVIGQDLLRWAVYPMLGLDWGSYVRFVDFSGEGPGGGTAPEEFSPKGGRGEDGGMASTVVGKKKSSRPGLGSLPSQMSRSVWRLQQGRKTDFGGAIITWFWRALASDAGGFGSDGSEQFGSNVVERGGSKGKFTPYSIEERSSGASVLILSVRMMPPYMYMDSCPHQSHQTPFTPRQAFPTNMPVDPARPAALFEPWPYGGNYSYPTPYHSCCNNGNFPGYYGFRPYAYTPMPSPLHFGGGYPVHYAPPPHYSMELPRYEYDKNMPRSYHCYGCPNHPYNSEEKGVKIEEQEPKVVEKKGSDSLVPIWVKNCPDPIIWVPQDYLHNKEQSKPFESEVAEQQKYSSKTKHPESLESSEQEPRIWNGWFPSDMNNVKSLVHGGDGKRTHDQQSKEQKRDSPFPFIWMPSYDNKQDHGKDNADMISVKDQRSEDGKRQFPFPIIWMPAYEKKLEEAEKKGNRDTNSPSKCEEKQPHIFNIVPAKDPGDDTVKDKSCANEENADSKGGANIEKIANHRSIPVIQIEPHKEEDSEDATRRGRDVPVNRPSSTNARRSSSPPKTPKLSPVCLRNTNDTVKESACLKENSQQDSKLEEGISSSSKEVQLNQKEKKLIKVTERKTSDNYDRGQTNVSPSNLPMQSTADASNKLVIEKPMEEGDEYQTKEDPEASVVGDAIADEPVEEKKATNPEKSDSDEKKTLSEEEAAVLMQSAYRGFDVRRWEPLKKLKQIAEIREQLVDVRNHIQTLESSSDLQKDNKQKVLIGESIMRLLLKLDAIQGLHSSLRDIRKSLARELVNLQEKLDSLMIGNSKESEVGVDFKTKQELGTVGQNSECVLKQEKHEEIEHYDSESTQDSYAGSVDMIEPCQDESLQMFDSGHSLKGNSSVSSCESIVQHFVAEDDRQKLSIASDVSLRQPDAEPLEEPNDVVVNGEPEASTTMVEETDKADAASESIQLVQAPLVVEDKMEILRPDFKTPNATGMETEDLEELPHEITDDMSAALEFDKDTDVGMSKKEVQQASEQDSTSEVISAADFDGAPAPGKDAEVLELVEFPIEVIEDTASSEFEKNGQVELEKNDDLLMEDKCQGATGATPLEVVITKGSEHPNEVHEDSNIEPEQCVKIGCEEDEEHFANLVLEGLKEGEERAEVSNNVPEPEESQLKYSPEEKETKVDIVGAKEELKGIHDEIGEHLSVLIREEGTETQEKNIDDTEQDKEAGFVTAKEEVFDGTTIDPMNIGQVEHDGEPIPASPTCSLVSTAETCSGVETNEKLKEENEKLRKMTEKLMEAGKEQLDVISNLTGRVKDLEKKLSKKKKLRTRQRKAASCSSAHVKRSNVSMKERIGGAAM